MANEKNDETGFNDDELKDIMDEIESLEKEFSDDEVVSPSETPVESPEPQMTQSEVKTPSVNKVESITKNSPKATPSFSGGAKSKMSFKVEGQIAMELDFEVSGKRVSLFVDEQEGITIELEDGAKFCLPVSAKAA